MTRCAKRVLRYSVVLLKVQLWLSFLDPIASLVTTTVLRALPPRHHAFLLLGTQQRLHGVVGDATTRSLLRLQTATNPSSSDSPYNDADGDKTSVSPPWLHWGLLISSWGDGVAASPRAKGFLRRGLTRALLNERRRLAEAAVSESVLQSPCCGPTNLEALLELETVDAALSDWTKQQQDNDGGGGGGDGDDDEQALWLDCAVATTTSASSTRLRVLYIPTAMYALRMESTNTPGKQRQRARADGKKRRNEVVKTLEDILQGQVVSTVTLDLDDGSVKQPEGFEDASTVPKDGQQALKEWKPHLVYIEGGNTFFLYHCIMKGHWKDALISAISGDDAAVFCGKSAGAIVAGARVETATWKGWDDPRVVPGMEEYDDWIGVKGLNLVGGHSFFPHMGDKWESLVDKKCQEFSDPKVLCLRDDEVCCVDGSQQRIEVLTAGLNPSRVQ